MVEYFKVCHNVRLEKPCRFWRCHIKYDSSMGKKQLKIFDVVHTHALHTCDIVSSCDFENRI